MVTLDIVPTDIVSAYFGTADIVTADTLTADIVLTVVWTADILRKDILSEDKKKLILYCTSRYCTGRNSVPVLILKTG